jgi:hypothetical protein
VAAFIKLLEDIVLRGPQEFVVGVVRLVLRIVLVLLYFLAKLWRCLLELLKTTNFYPEESGEKDCGRIPEPYVRRPDPCIYSQFYLAAQGLPVTWNNPDIWLAPASNPTAIEPDSYHLHADTDYVVSVRAHNASTDAAIGVRVQLVYRPWSFNSPDLIPVETDAAGHEVFRFVNIAPMGFAIAQFKWRTPKVDPGQQAHFCIQARLSHPLDTNPANNVGQENTDVYGAALGPVAPGDIVPLEVPLYNPERQAQVFRFRWDRYEIDAKDGAVLKLKVNEGRARMPRIDRLWHDVPTVNPILPRREGRGRAALGRIDFATPKSGFRTAKTKYVGFEELRKRILSANYSLPAGTVRLANGDETLRVDAETVAVAKFEITIPNDAKPGRRFAVNIRAVDPIATILGGVTIYFDVKP